MSYRVICLVLCVLLVAENILFYNMLKSARKIVDDCEEKYKWVYGLFEKVMMYYDACMKSNDAVDKNYALVKEQYDNVISLHERFMEIVRTMNKQEENKNGMAV